MYLLILEIGRCDAKLLNKVYIRGRGVALLKRNLFRNSGVTLIIWNHFQKLIRFKRRAIITK